VREIRTLRVMRRELETGARGHLRPTAPVPDPTNRLITSMISTQMEFSVGTGVKGNNGSCDFLNGPEEQAMGCYYYLKDKLLSTAGQEDLGPDRSWNSSKLRILRWRIAQ